MTDLCPDVQAKLRAQECKAEEWVRDGRGLWAMRRCMSAPSHGGRHLFTSWTYNVQPPGQSSERARQQGLKKALIDLVEDLEARWDMNDSHTNPGIRHCVEQAIKALRCADEMESSR